MKLRAISILQYQNVTDSPELHRLWLSLHSFRKQLEHLLENGFRVISMDHAMDYMQKTEDIGDGRPISLTFDNGYLDFYDKAFPTLSSRFFPATVLVSPPNVGEKIMLGNQTVHYMNWEQLNELVRHRVTVGAYEDGALDINEVPEEVVKGHVRAYKEMLEDKLGVEIQYFGVKEGVPSRGIRDTLISSGYRAFLTQCPTYRKPDLFSVGRIQVDDDDFNIFLTKISKTYLFFKDKKTWEYIRRFSLDRVAHKVSETYDKIRGNR
ncbi:MAG: polysaccharide deacetylase family protein [Deltaproteobacteria bacterium]|nr:polysaccharide deacetylase family protein [Deltaproteobacteria bacterium]MBW2137452.1 polysaccharide deacetylase family protein [Deltaproteobacteria bacterium]